MGLVQRFCSVQLCHKFYSVFPLWKKQGKALGRAFPIPVVLRSNETADEYEAEFWRRVTFHVDATKQRSKRISFAMKRAHEIMGGKRPPINSRHASSASPSGPSRKKTAGAASHKQPPAQARQRAKRPQAPTSQSSLGNPSIGQGFVWSFRFTNRWANSLPTRKRVFPSVSTNTGGAL